MRATWFLLLLLPVFVLSGCGGEKAGNTASTEEGGEETSAEVKSYTAEELPELEDPLPPQDQGRVVFALPTGWKTLPKGSKSLAAFIPEDSSAAKLPRITILAADSPLEDFTSVGTPNVAEFAAKMNAVSVKEGKKIKEATKPLNLGENSWARHVRIAKFSDAPAAIQSLQTVRSGRLYTVELIIPADADERYANSLKKYRDFAYAVAANMTFPKDGGVPAAAAPGSEANPAAEASPTSEANPSGEANPTAEANPTVEKSE
jgi:hypothetical protein